MELKLKMFSPKIPEGTAVVTLTDGAAYKIKELSGKSPEAKGKYLRVYVQGGGCSGYTYGFKFDDRRPDDRVIEKGGATLLLDPQSAELLVGSTVDYNDGLTGAGFIVKNPNATGTCGCGTSFSV